MKTWIYFIILSAISISSNSQSTFDKYFSNKTLRFDFHIAGNFNSQEIFFEEIKEEPYWGGPHQNLIDPFDFGDYRYLVFDSISNELLFKRGYSDLFFEWQSTPEAQEISRSFYSSLVFPYPNKTIRLEIDYRKKNQEWEKLYETHINPQNYFIHQEKSINTRILKKYAPNNPEKAVDIVILGDGYTRTQKRKFHSDCKRFVDYFFRCSPFGEHRKDFNFWIVDAYSEDKGTDIPGKEVWKNTLLNTHFFTFGSERYLTTRDVRSMRNLAGLVPYDQIYILVNTSKYGGGGIYNFYNLCTADHPQSEKVFTHEFGHAFAALADEYAYEDTPAEDLYDLSVEPYQVNISTLAHFEQKWKSKVKEGTPIPTPDSLATSVQIGAFEGAGYKMHNIYRPGFDCKMRSNQTNDFCPVCLDAILKMIDFYCDRPVQYDD